MADLPRYDLPNPGLPLGQQAVSPVAQTNPLQSLAQGGVQGFSLGLQARQLQQLETLRKSEEQKYLSEAKKQEEKDNLEKIKFHSSLISEPWFQNLSPEDQQQSHSEYVHHVNKFLGTNYDENAPYEAEDSKVAKDVSAIMDSDHTMADKRKLISSRLIRAASTIKKDQLSEIRSSAEMALGKQGADNESSQFVGMQNGQGVIWNPKQSTFTQQPLPGTGTFIPKTEPAKLQEQVMANDEAVKLIGDLKGSLEGISGFSGGMKALGSKLTAGAIEPKLRLYQQQRPAIAVKLYRALTGDTRLSDADAMARAYPLLPEPYEPDNVQQSKMQALQDAAEGRNSRITQLLTGVVPQSESSTPVNPHWSNQEEQRFQELEAQRNKKK